MITEKFLTLVDEVISQELSDLHITTGDVPYIRTHTGMLSPVKSFGIVEASMIKEMVRIILQGRNLEGKTVDCSYLQKNRRFRVNISQNVRGISISMRTIPTAIPSPQDVSLSRAAVNLFHREKGIILVTGPTGSGKTTTLAAMIEYLNMTQPKHIITLEDPIEFVFKNKKALVHQREKGAHFDEFSPAIRSILREDPDIIMVGEMRDLATIEAALTLAETGHLVLSTLHTNDTPQSVDRIVYSFPGEMQNQVRMQFSLSLIGIISQILIPRIDNTGRVPAREILINNDAVRNLIARGEIAQIYSVLEMSKREGMVLMDDTLIDLIERRIIAPESAVNHMRDLSRLESMRHET